MSVDTEATARRSRSGRSSRPPRTPAEPVAPVVATPAPPRLPGRRNHRWVALGVLAMCLGGLLAYALYTRVTTETTVLVMAGTVYRGEVVDAADLTSVTLHGDLPEHAVPLARQDSVVGKRAVYDLPQGSVVAATSVADAALPASGSAVVGLRLATGRAPAALLVPSAPVRVVALPPAATSAGGADALTGKTYLGRVVSQAPGADGTSVVVDLEVAADQGPTVAMLGAQERVALVRDAGR